MFLKTLFYIEYASSGYRGQKHGNSNIGVVVVEVKSM